MIHDGASQLRYRRLALPLRLNPFHRSVAGDDTVLSKEVPAGFHGQSHTVADLLGVVGMNTAEPGFVICFECAGLVAHDLVDFVGPVNGVSLQIPCPETHATGAQSDVEGGIALAQLFSGANAFLGHLPLSLLEDKALAQLLAGPVARRWARPARIADTEKRGQDHEQGESDLLIHKSV